MKFSKMMSSDSIMTTPGKNKADLKVHPQHQANGVHLVRTGTNNMNNKNKIMKDSPNNRSTKKLKINMKNRKKPGKSISERIIGRNSKRGKGISVSSIKNRNSVRGKININNNKMQRISIIEINIIKGKAHRARSKEDIKNNNTNIKERPNTTDIDMMGIRILKIKINIASNSISIGTMHIRPMRMRGDGRSTSNNKIEKTTKITITNTRKGKNSGPKRTKKLRNR